MNWTSSARTAIACLALCCYGLPQAEAIEIVGGSSPVLQRMRARSRRSRRGAAAPVGLSIAQAAPIGPCTVPVISGRCTAPVTIGPYIGLVIIGLFTGPSIARSIVVPSHVHRNVWVRPGSYRWSPGGAIAAGAALGFVSAAAAATWAGAAPQPGLCWFYTDTTRRQGFWDNCP